MDESVPSSFGCSQSNLAIYHQCRRRFFLRYVRRLDWPAPLTAAAEELERAIGRGQLFHYLVQQDILGMDVSAVVQHHGDVLLEAWWRNYTLHPPAGIPAGRTFSEIQLSVPLGPYRLRAKFDRVVMGRDGRVWIVDWKTGQQRPQQKACEESWQTLVYRYVLVEAGESLVEGRAIAPDQVSLVYWHASFPDLLRPIGYSRSEHEAAGKRLEAVAAEWAALCQEEDFPRTEDVELCRRCEYRSYCERGRTPADEWEIDEEDLDWDLIPEAEL